MSPQDQLQDAVDNPIHAVDGCILLSRRCGPYNLPLSLWSKYSADANREGFGHDRGPVHSQGPSHFSGYGAYSDDVDKEAHDSRSVTKPSHDSRGPMLASKGLLARTDRGPNTGVHNTVNSTSLLGNFDTTLGLEKGEPWLLLAVVLSHFYPL